MSVSCGLGHAIAIADSGRSVFSWGAGAFGQTGQGVFTPSSEPKSVLFANASGRRNQEGWQTFRAVSCGPYSTAIVSEEGKVYFCGDGMNGQLANGKNNRQCIATDSPYISEAMQSVAMGESHVLLLASNFLFLTNFESQRTGICLHADRIALGNLDLGTEDLQESPYLFLI